jgi:hypothetical protein
MAPTARTPRPPYPVPAATTHSPAAAARVQVRLTSLLRTLLLRYCYVTAMLLLRYCYVNVTLLLRYCYFTVTLLLCYFYVTATLLLR